MLSAISQSPFARSLFFVFVVFVFCASAAEIAAEFAAGEAPRDMVDDVLGLAFSGVLFIVLVGEHRARRRALEQLRGQLDKGRGQLAKIDQKSQKVASQYREVVQRQFDAWSLTASEQDVVIGMLKGLSFREIAELRDTREKTVRQQASSVYRKAGVGSRNELAAWFFEDLLEPPPVQDG